MTQYEAFSISGMETRFFACNGYIVFTNTKGWRKLVHKTTPYRLLFASANGAMRRILGELKENMLRRNGHER